MQRFKYILLILGTGLFMMVVLNLLNAPNSLSSATNQAQGEKQIISASVDERPDERPIAFVRRFKPNVRIFNLSVDKFKKAEKAEKLYDGDTLATGENGYAAIQFMDNSLAKVTPSSLLLINGSVDNETRSTSTRILLNAGEIMMDVKENQGDFEVATQTSVATVKGTEFGSSSQANGASQHFVLEGEVEVNAMESNQTVTITSGQYASVDQNGQNIETGELDQDELEQRQKEFREFDKNMEPKKIKFEFKGEDGEVQQVEIEYYEN